MPGYHQSLADNSPPVQSVAPQLANNTTLNGTSVDLQGWNGVELLLSVGATDTTVDLKAQESDDNSTFTDITGASLTQFSATDDNKAAVLDVWRPSKRYVRPVVTIGNGTTGANVSVTARPYVRNGLTPVTQVVKELKKVQVN